MLWYHLLPLVTASLKGCSDGITCRTVNASGLSFDCRFAVPTTTPATNTTVMLLHGFPEWSVMYVNLMRTLSSHGYSSVACNQRGYSPGAAPAGVTNYNYNTLAEDVWNIADAVIGRTTKFHLVGHDHGAALGWTCATTPTGTARLLSYSSLSIPHLDAFSAGLYGPTADLAQQAASQYFTTFVLNNSATLHNDFWWNTMGKQQFSALSGAFKTPADFQKALYWYNGMSMAGKNAMPPLMSEAQLLLHGFAEAAALRAVFGGTPNAGTPATHPTGNISVPTLYVCGDSDTAILCSKKFALKTKDYVDPGTSYTQLTVKCGHDLLSCATASETNKVIAAIVTRLSTATETTTTSGFAKTTSKTPPQVIFSYSSTGPFPCIRIPSALALPDGTILAFAETRRWIGDQCYPDAPKPAAPIQESNRSICLRRSLDKGVTWEPLRPNISQRYSANPTAVHIAATNRTLLIFDDTLNGGLYMQESKDSGVSWSTATRLVTAAGVPILAVCGPGNAAVATKNGTLFVAGYHANRAWTNSFSFSSVYRSDDHGKSWEDVSPAITPSEAAAGLCQDSPRCFPHLGEPSLTQLTTGEILLNARCPDGRKPYPGPAQPCDCDCHGVSISQTSRGETWGSTAYDANGTTDPDCQGAAITLRNGSVLFSNLDSATARMNPSLRLGELVKNVAAREMKWSKAVSVPGANARTIAGYSSLFQMMDGAIGILWETSVANQTKCRGEGCSIVFSIIR